LFEDRIYVRHDAAVVELPQVQLLWTSYTVHTNGAPLPGCQLDGLMVPLNTPLQNRAADCRGDHLRRGADHRGTG
jgi:(p)ppGpp synthase/HD superfamily hydrolase